MLKFGSCDIEDIKLGSLQVDKMMLGSTEVWSKSQSPDVYEKDFMARRQNDKTISFIYNPETSPYMDRYNERYFFVYANGVVFVFYYGRETDLSLEMANDSNLSENPVYTGIGVCQDYNGFLTDSGVYMYFYSFSSPTWKNNLGELIDLFFVQNPTWGIAPNFSICSPASNVSVDIGYNHVSSLMFYDT